MNYRRDIRKTNSAIKNRDRSKYSKIYRFTNESLNDLFSNIDVKDKSVLSVLGSGDQVFSFLDKGAKKIDIFDKNRLAKYYFYLRKWAIIAFNDFYPNIFSNDYIYALLQNVTPKTD